MRLFNYIPDSIVKRYPYSDDAVTKYRDFLRAMEPEIVYDTTGSPQNPGPLARPIFENVQAQFAESDNGFVGNEINVDQLHVRCTLNNYEVPYGDMKMRFCIVYDRQPADQNRFPAHPVRWPDVFRTRVINRDSTSEFSSLQAFQNLDNISRFTVIFDRLFMMPYAQFRPSIPPQINPCVHGWYPYSTGFGFLNEVPAATAGNQAPYTIDTRVPMNEPGHQPQIAAEVLKLPMGSWTPTMKEVMVDEIIDCDLPFTRDPNNDVGDFKTGALLYFFVFESNDRQAGDPTAFFLDCNIRISYRDAQPQYKKRMKIDV